MNSRFLEYVKSNNYELLSSEFFCDFKIIIQDDHLLCHKCVLYSGSEFFKAFFNFNQKQEEIRLSDGIVTLTGIKNCLLFIYALGYEFNLCEENCEETYVAADFLQINALKLLASKSISGNINIINAFGIIRFSVTYNDHGLRMNARNFINNNFNKICLDNKDFLSLSFDILSEIISDKNLSSTEFAILKALLKWAQHDADNRNKAILENIDKLVLLHLISTEQWNSLSTDSGCSILKDAIRTMHFPLKFYSDSPHRIGTPIVLYSIGSRRSDMLDWNNNFFCIDHTIDWLSPMVEDRTNHMVCASSTFIFVIGGESAEGFIFKSCERYNLVEKRWERMAELDCHRSNFAVACLEGFVYLFGGNTVEEGEAGCTASRDILIYDSGSDFWRKLPYETPTQLIDAVAVGHCSYVYVAGGLNDRDHPVHRVSEFDPASGEWTPLETVGLPEDIFSAANVRRLSLAAGGSSPDNEGFLLLSGRARDLDSVYAHHFSLNRWRLSVTMETTSPLEFRSYRRVQVLCERDAIAVVHLVTTDTLERLHLHEPPSDSLDDELLLYVKFQISSDWSGELDLVNHSLWKPFSVRPGYQFLLAPLVPE